MGKDDHNEQSRDDEMVQIVQIDDPESPGDCSKVKYIDHLKDGLIENCIANFQMGFFVFLSEPFKVS